MRARWTNVAGPAIAGSDTRIAMGVGLFASATALSSFSFLTAIHLGFFDIPSWFAPATAGMFGFLIGFILTGRAAVADLWNTFEPKTKMAMVMVLGAAFALSTFTHGTQPATGLAALHLAMLVCLVSPRGFGYYYILSGATMGICLLHLQPQVAAILASIFVLLLVLTCAYDSFFFTMEANPVASPVSAFLPLRLALSRFFLVALLVGPAAWLLPLPNAFLQRAPRQTPAPAQPGLNPEQFNLDMMKVAFYTVLLIALLVGLFALLRYLRNKLRRKSSELVPESIGVPVAAPYRHYHEGEGRRAFPADTPRERIVQLYHAFGLSFKSQKSRRKPSQTPAEYARLLENRAALSAEQVRQITRSFVSARYSPEAPTWQDVAHFEKMATAVPPGDEDDTASTP